MRSDLIILYLGSKYLLSVNPTPSFGEVQVTVMSYQRDFEARLNVGIVGVGSHAYRNILPTMTFLPVRLQTICDLDLDRAQITADQYGVSAYYRPASEMYTQERLDAVF